MKRAEKGGIPMRLILKILLFPVVLVLTIFVAICRFLCAFSTVLLSIFALILFALALATMIFLHDMSNGLKVLVLSWLISPFGIPLFASWLVEKADDLNCRLKAV
jgi:hypothetical protein